MRARPAPRAWCIAISFWRFADRARMSPATFAHAISKTKPTAAMITFSIGATLPLSPLSACRIGTSVMAGASLSANREFPTTWLRKRAVAADCACGTGDRVGLFYLTEDLGFAEDHGVETGRDAEEMADRVLIQMGVDVRGQHRWIESELAMQEACDVGLRRFDGGKNLHAVAGGEDHAFGYSRLGRECAQGLGQLVARDRDALAELDWRCFVIDSDEGERHGAPNLWTWLTRLAAQTASIKARTAPER